MHELAFASPLFRPGSRAPVLYTPQTDSTMDDAARLCRSGSPSGTVVVTDFQRSGRGRRAGRRWYAEPRESLMFTLAEHEPARPAERSLAMAASIVMLLQERWALEVRVKWPNDILVHDRKLCGILADHDGTWLYLGVGLNVRQRSFPPEIAATATSLALEGVDPGEWEPFRDSLLADLLGRYARGDEWRETLESRLWMRDERVIVRGVAGEETRGVIRGLSPDGALLLESDRLRTLAAGELSLVRTDDDA